MAIRSLLLIGPIAMAPSMSFSGTFVPDRPNDLHLVEFELAAAGLLSIQTWGIGGTGATASRTNAAAALVMPGRFDSYVLLFAATGSCATFVASNEDGLCPSGTPLPDCAT